MIGEGPGSKAHLMCETGLRRPELCLLLPEPGLAVMLAALSRLMDDVHSLDLLFYDNPKNQKNESDSDEDSITSLTSTCAKS